MLEMRTGDNFRSQILLSRKLRIKVQVGINSTTGASTWLEAIVRRSVSRQGKDVGATNLKSYRSSKCLSLIDLAILVTTLDS